MGGDGGVVATSRRFMRGGGSAAGGGVSGSAGAPGTGAAAEAVTAAALAERRRERTRLCAVSGAPLLEPIVVCEMGCLANKEEVLRALLRREAQGPGQKKEENQEPEQELEQEQKEEEEEEEEGLAGVAASRRNRAGSLPETMAHVRSLKDVKTCILTRNPEATARVERLEDSQAALCADVPPPFICPVTYAEMDGERPFVAVWTTGHVLSARAVSEMGIAALQAEYGPFDSTDLIKLCPSTPEEVALQRAAMQARRARRAATKKGKKHKKRSKDRSSRSGSSSGSSSSGTRREKKSRKSRSSGSVHEAEGSTEGKREVKDGRKEPNLKRQRLGAP